MYSSNSLPSAGRRSAGACSSGTSINWRATSVRTDFTGSASSGRRRDRRSFTSALLSDETAPRRISGSEEASAALTASSCCGEGNRPLSSTAMERRIGGLVLPSTYARNPDATEGLFLAGGRQQRSLRIPGVRAARALADDIRRPSIVSILVALRTGVGNAELDAGDRIGNPEGVISPNIHAHVGLRRHMAVHALCSRRFRIVEEMVLGLELLLSHDIAGTARCRSARTLPLCGSWQFVHET